MNLQVASQREAPNSTPLNGSGNSAALATAGSDLITLICNDSKKFQYRDEYVGF